MLHPGSIPRDAPDGYEMKCPISLEQDILHERCVACDSSNLPRLSEMHLPVLGTSSSFRNLRTSTPGSKCAISIARLQLHRRRAARESSILFVSLEMQLEKVGLRCALSVEQTSLQERCAACESASPFASLGMPLPPPGRGRSCNFHVCPKPWTALQNLRSTSASENPHLSAEWPHS